MPVKNRFAELLPEITEWRRDIHENPELLFEVHRTAAKVAAADIAATLRRLLAGQGAVRMVFAAAPSQADTLDALRRAPGIDWRFIDHAF